MAEVMGWVFFSFLVFFFFSRQVTTAILADAKHSSISQTCPGFSVNVLTRQVTDKAPLSSCPSPGWEKAGPDVALEWN